MTYTTGVIIEVLLLAFSMGAWWKSRRSAVQTRFLRVVRAVNTLALCICFLFLWVSVAMPSQINAVGGYRNYDISADPLTLYGVLPGACLVLNIIFVLPYLVFLPFFLFRQFQLKTLKSWDTVSHIVIAIMLGFTAFAAFGSIMFT